MTIGMIGNFRVSYSTESDRKWSFEKLGHEVITFQENEVTAEQIKGMLPMLDMLVYSHTHGWEIKGLKEVFEYAKTINVPSVSVHLDRWAWLDRVKDIGNEATWFTEYIFMADGSPEAVELYKEHDLNWYYLPPGVIERDCYIAEPHHERFPHEIVFTGSRQYHPEYPFRHELVDFLKETYGDRFGHYGNDGIGVMREKDLNTLYSTAKIVVGDSCFGGRPHYTSDRYYEVRGRGGFLLHPLVAGVDYNGVGFYERGNLADLKQAIDDNLKNDKQRELKRKDGFEWVKEHGTYTNRAQTIIETVFK